MNYEVHDGLTSSRNMGIESCCILGRASNSRNIFGTKNVILRQLIYCP